MSENDRSYRDWKANRSQTGTYVMSVERGCCRAQWLRVLVMRTTSNPYRGFRFPSGIINQAVWLYHRFSLSLRDIELILAARSVVVSYETIRKWSLRFGRTFAKANLRKHS